MNIIENFSSIFYSPAFKNAALFAAYLYGAIKLPNIIKKKLNGRYSFISNWIVPLGYIASLRMSSIYLELTLKFVPGSWFISEFIHTFVFVYNASYFMSLITFIIGYPTINIIGTVGYHYFSNFINQLIIKHQHLINNVLSIYRDLNKNLVENNNWDITFRGISVKVWQTNRPIDALELDKRCPLKCNSLTKSTSDFLSDNCSICYDILDTDKLHRELLCKHVFHPECIDPWLTKCNGVCPICKCSVFKEQMLSTTQN